MKSSIETILESPESISEESIKEINKTFINEILDGTLDSYYEILNQYIHAKKEKNILTSDISNHTGLPELTVKRFENLKSVPRVLTAIKILHAVGLQLTVVPIDSNAKLNIN